MQGEVSEVEPEEVTPEDEGGSRRGKEPHGQNPWPSPEMSLMFAVGELKGQITAITRELAELREGLTADRHSTRKEVADLENRVIHLERIVWVASGAGLVLGSGGTLVLRLLGV